jgi:hypothetical protein
MGGTYEVLEELAREPAFAEVVGLDLGGLPRDRGKPDSPLAPHYDGPVRGEPNIFFDYLDGRTRSRLSPEVRAFCGRLREVTIGVDYEWHGPENAAFLRSLFPTAEVFLDDAYPMVDGQTKRLLS